MAWHSSIMRWFLLTCCCWRAAWWLCVRDPWANKNSTADELGLVFLLVSVNPENRTSDCCCCCCCCWATMNARSCSMVSGGSLFLVDIAGDQQKKWNGLWVQTMKATLIPKGKNEINRMIAYIVHIMHCSPKRPQYLSFPQKRSPNAATSNSSLKLKDRELWKFLQ